MRVEFAFDSQKAELYGYRIGQIIATLRRIFEKDGFRCTSEHEVIVFEGDGHEDDFANMWLNLQDLINSSWFLKCASACRWYDLSDNGEEELVEDVLAQAHCLVRKKA